jgi:hypothetical protein
MKKLLFIIALASSQLIFAQNMEFRNNLSLQSGTSLFSFLRRAEVTPGTDIKFTGGNVKAIPTIQGAYDFAVNDWLSVGLAGSYNRATLSFNDISTQGKVIGNASVKVARTSLAVRLLGHYGRGKWDVYSGGRLGGAFWYGKVSTDINEELVTDLISSVNSDLIPGFLKNRLTGPKLGGGYPMLQLQVIPIGARYYFTDNFGANAELAFGAPYFFSLGANYRF